MDLLSEIKIIVHIQCHVDCIGVKNSILCFKMT